MKIKALLKTTLILALMFNFSSCKDDKNDNTIDLPKIGNVVITVGSTTYTIPAIAHNETFENQGGVIAIGQVESAGDYVQIFVSKLDGPIIGGEYHFTTSESAIKMATIICIVNDVSYNMISGTVMVSKITGTEFQGSFTGLVENSALSSDTKTISGAFNLLVQSHSTYE